MSRKYWSISYWDSGAGAWVNDVQIPRAGLETFSRLDEATLEFIALADGSEAALSSETKNKWGELILVFPKQVVTETIKTQLIGYIDNERGIKIPMPIITGASSYTEKIIEGYPIRYEENWELDNRDNQRFVTRLTIHEFDVDGDGAP